MVGRPKKLQAAQAVHILIPGNVVERLDAWVEDVRVGVPGGSGITRADLIRDLLLKAVEDREAKKGAGGR